KSIPTVEFTSVEEAVHHLNESGFLNVDAYLGALEIVSSQAGAEVVLSESFEQPKLGQCELHTRVIDSSRNSEMPENHLAIPCPVPSLGDKLTELTDPTGTMLIISDNKSTTSAQPHSPQCDKCPAPPYSETDRKRGAHGVVRILATITPEGRADNIR